MLLLCFLSLYVWKVMKFLTYLSSEVNFNEALMLILIIATFLSIIKHYLQKNNAIQRYYTKSLFLLSSYEINFVDCRLDNFTLYLEYINAN